MMYRVVSDWPEKLPNGWITGHVSGVFVDSHDNVYTVNRRGLTAKEERQIQLGRAERAPAIIKYDADGKVVQGVTPRQLPQGLHSCYIDHEDNLWIGGAGDAVVVKYPLSSLTDDSDPSLVIGDAGCFDETNQSKIHLNRPADIAVDPTNGLIYIADGYGNRRIVVFEELSAPDPETGRNYRWVGQWGRQGSIEAAEAGLPNQFLDVVHAVAQDKAGLVYVNDRKGNRIHVYGTHLTSKGQLEVDFVRNIWIPPDDETLPPEQHDFHNDSIGFAWELAFSRDSEQALIFNTDGERERVWVLERDTGDVLGWFGGAGHMAGEFTFLHSIDVDSKGNVYTGETIGGQRLQKFERIQ